MHICEWTGSSLVKVKACHLCGAKPLPQPMLIINQTPRNISVKFYLKIKSSFKKMHSKMSAKCQPFCLSLNVLIQFPKPRVFRNHSGYGLSQWEMPLQCKVVSHRLSLYLEWSLVLWPKMWWLLMTVYMTLQESFCVWAQPMRDDVTM